MPSVLIIGAGPAGSAAAILLARAGVAVRVVEQSRFPRDKVCGECISSLGWSVLERLDLTQVLLAAGAAALRRTVLHSAEGVTARLGLPRPMYGLSRRVMDELLLKEAVAAGARILQPVRCEGIVGRTATLRRLVDNSVTDVSADQVLLADGKSALLPPKPAGTEDLGLKAHFAGVRAEGDAIHLFGLRGHYVGIAPIEGEIFNVAMSVPRRRIEAKGDFDALFGEMLGENTALRRQLGGAERISPWLSSALPRFGVRRDWPEGVIPLGNAAAALEPIGGEGIGLALRSAELAAGALLAAFAKGRQPDAAGLRRQFTGLWNVRRTFCRAAGLYLSSPNLSGPGLHLLEGDSGFSRIAVSLLGK